MSAKEEPTRDNHSHLSQHKPSAQNMWYDWWWNYQHSLYQSGRNEVNHYATWCTTCVEEQRLREERVNKLTNGCHTHIDTNNIITNSSSFNSCERYDRSNEVGNNSSHDVEEMSDHEDDSDDEFEMELNNDFKKFLEQSARHKEQRSEYNSVNPDCRVWHFRQDLRRGKAKQFIFSCAKSFLGVENVLQARLRYAGAPRCRQ